MADYIKDIRKLVGHRPLICCAGSVIIVNAEGKLLLGRRTDNHLWGYAGGSVEIVMIIREIESDPANDAAIKAYRGYFEILDFEENFNAGANINILVDGDATAIEGITINGRNMNTGDVYTVSGMYMGRAENVMNTLPAGIYIVNNKKVIIK